MIADEPLLSPKRLLAAIRQWLFWLTRDPPVGVPLGKLLRYHRRPAASDRDGFY